MTEFRAAGWRKSSYSDGAGGTCVEVASVPGAFGVRDSKDRDGGMLVFGLASWSSFAAGVKTGWFDR